MSKSKKEEKTGSNWDGPEKGMSGEMIFTGQRHVFVGKIPLSFLTKKNSDKFRNN